MARIIAVANQKGGVGKTTSTISLGAALAEQGQRVLLVDSDPQASLTDAIGIDAASLTQSLYDVLLGKVPLSDVLVEVARLTVAPATIDLAAAEFQLNNEIGREQILSNALVRVAAQFDTILIDCPPSLGIMTINALTAADELIIPVECHYMALRGLNQLMDTIEKVQRRLNPRLRVVGVIPTMFNDRTVHENEVLQTLQEQFPDLVTTPVRRSVRFAETALAGKPLLAYDPHHPGVQAYRTIAREVLG